MPTIQLVWSNQKIFLILLPNFLRPLPTSPRTFLATTTPTGPPTRPPATTAPTVAPPIAFSVPFLPDELEEEPLPDDELALHPSPH